MINTIYFCFTLQRYGNICTRTTKLDVWPFFVDKLPNFIDKSIFGRFSAKFGTKFLAYIIIYKLVTLLISYYNYIF